MVPESYEQTFASAQGCRCGWRTRPFFSSSSQEKLSYRPGRLSQKPCGQQSNHSSLSDMWKPLLAAIALASPVLGQENPSAYEALRTVGTQLNRSMINRVISVSGVDGDPQPKTWKILVADKNAAGGAREIIVEGNQVMSQRV